MKSARPAALVGTNAAGTPGSYYLFGRIIVALTSIIVRGSLAARSCGPSGSPRFMPPPAYFAFQEGVKRLLNP